VLVVNIFTNGLSNPWFLYPSVPLGLYILLRRRGGRGNPAP
jgi:hypothetical protein